MRPANLHQGLENRLLVGATLPQDLGCRGLSDIEKTEQEMFRADIIVLQLFRLNPRLIKRLLETKGDIDVPLQGSDGWDLFQLPFKPIFQEIEIDLQFLEERTDKTFLLIDQGKEEMFRFDLLVMVCLRLPLGLEDRFLCLNGKLF
jgi:hypothetical protein